MIFFCGKDQNDLMGRYMSLEVPECSQLLLNTLNISRFLIKNKLKDNEYLRTKGKFFSDDIGNMF
jgi:hypothetical protein